LVGLEADTPPASVVADRVNPPVNRVLALARGDGMTRHQHHTGLAREGPCVAAG